MIFTWHAFSRVVSSFGRMWWDGLSSSTCWWLASRQMDSIGRFGDWRKFSSPSSTAPGWRKQVEEETPCLHTETLIYIYIYMYLFNLFGFWNTRVAFQMYFSEGKDNLPTRQKGTQHTCLDLLLAKSLFSEVMTPPRLWICSAALLDRSGHFCHLCGNWQRRCVQSRGHGESMTLDWLMLLVGSEWRFACKLLPVGGNHHICNRWCTCILAFYTRTDCQCPSVSENGLQWI